MRRAKAGLPPLEVYLKQWYINYKVPTAAYQNPADLYYLPQQHTESPLQIIGGTDALFKKLTYPEAARTNHISGFVTLELTVDKDGKLKDPLVVNSLGYGCDEEVLRVIKEAKFSNTSGEEQGMRIRFPFPYLSKP